MMADIKKLAAKKPKAKDTAKELNRLLAESDRELINNFDVEPQHRAMPKGISKRYVQNR